MSSSTQTMLSSPPLQGRPSLTPSHSSDSQPTSFKSKHHHSTPSKNPLTDLEIALSRYLPPNFEVLVLAGKNESSSNLTPCAVTTAESLVAAAGVLWGVVYWSTKMSRFVGDLRLVV